MKREMKWITIWILINSVMAALSFTYLYLSHELERSGVSVMSLYLLMIILPYCVWKYNQTKFVKKRTIVIQILND